MRKDARFLAYTILDQFNSDVRLDLILNKIFIDHDPDLRARSRAKVLVNEIIRLIDRLDLMIKYISGRDLKQIQRPIRSILRIGFYEIAIDDIVPDYAAVDSAVQLVNRVSNRRAAGFTNAVLRKLVRKKSGDENWSQTLTHKPEWNSMPLWIQDRWKKNLGQEGFTKMLDSVNKNPPNFVRIRPHIRNVEKVREILLEDEIDSEIFSESFLKIKGGTGKILQTELFNNGEISIQNPASAAVVDCLDARPGDKVLDVCAAPGTKSLYLSNIVGDSGKVLASDLIEERVGIGKRDLERHGKLNIEWRVKDASKDTFPMTDRMLIDAPCTGTGVLGRKPDIRWRRKISDVQEMSKKQNEILSHCAKFLKPNGILVYATCSIEPEENWNVVERFLKLNPQFSLDTIHSKVPRSWIDEKGVLRTLPYVHDVDGMFAAKIKRS